jgi:hypothetical protein
MGTVKGILSVFVWLYFKHLKLVYERLHLNYEWENVTCHENDDAVSATTTGFMPG